MFQSWWLRVDQLVAWRQLQAQRRRIEVQECWELKDRVLLLVELEPRVWQQFAEEVAWLGLAEPDSLLRLEV